MKRWPFFARGGVVSRVMAKKIKDKKRKKKREEEEEEKGHFVFAQ